MGEVSYDSEGARIVDLNKPIRDIHGNAYLRTVPAAANQTEWSFTDTDIFVVNPFQEKEYAFGSEDAPQGFTKQEFWDDNNNYHIYYAKGDGVMPVEVLWLDEEEKADRPESMQGSLLYTTQASSKTELAETFTLYGSSAEKSQNDRLWSFGLKNLRSAMIDDNGKLVRVSYSVDAEDIEGYQKTVEPLTNQTNAAIPGYRITYSIPKTYKVKVIWADGGDTGRPQSLEAKLMEGTSEAVPPLTLNAGNDWNGAFASVPKYDGQAQLRNYSIAVLSAAGYTAACRLDADDVFVIEFAKLTEVKTVVEWMDGDSASGRPAEVSFKLTADNAEITEDAAGTAIPTAIRESDGWTLTVPNLPEYKVTDGKVTKINYQVTTGEAASYVCHAFQESSNSFTVRYTFNGNSVPVSVVWHDAGERAARPRSVLLDLFVKLGDQSPKVMDQRALYGDTSSDTWETSFDGLPSVWSDGSTPAYSVDGEPVDGYMKSVAFACFHHDAYHEYYSSVFIY